jgi:hypothetical protein
MDLKNCANNLEVVRQTSDSAKKVADMMDPTEINNIVFKQIKVYVDNGLKDNSELLKMDFEGEVKGMEERLDKLIKEWGDKWNSNQEAIDSIKKLQNNIANKLNFMNQD